jgi:hypothetical protein
VVSSAHSTQSTGDDVAAICKEVAMEFLQKKVNRDFGEPTDVKGINLKLSKKNVYEAVVNSADKSFMTRLKDEKALTSKRAQELAFDEYRVHVPDLPSEFYEEVSRKKAKL